MFESLWVVLEERNVFLHQHVLEKEWLKIPLATVKDLYLLFPGHVHAGLATKGGPSTPY